MSSRPRRLPSTTPGPASGTINVSSSSEAVANSVVYALCILTYAADEQRDAVAAHVDVLVTLVQRFPTDYIRDTVLNAFSWLTGNPSDVRTAARAFQSGTRSTAAIIPI